MNAYTFLNVSLIFLCSASFVAHSENIYEETEKKFQKEKNVKNKFENEFKRDISEPYEQLIEAYVSQSRHTFEEVNRMVFELNLIQKKLLASKNEIFKLPHQNSSSLKKQLFSYEEKITKSIAILSAAKNENDTSSSGKSRGGVNELKWLDATRSFSVVCNNGFRDVFMDAPLGGYCGRAADGTSICSKQSTVIANHLCK